MDNSILPKLAVPGVVLLIAILSYSSQYLFYAIEPGPLDSRQAKIFNLLVIGIWITYARACTTDPGSIPKGWSPQSITDNPVPSDGRGQTRQRYCRKCPIIARSARDVSPKWTITALGPTIVYRITLSPISCAFYVWGLGGGVTTIESWEIERHEQLLRRARVLGGYLDGPDRIRVKIVRQEFPYDIGIWSNIAQGMGSSNPLAWFWPFSQTPKTDGLLFEENGFEDPGLTWPPPDPDRMPRASRGSDVLEDPFNHHQGFSPAEEILAFKKRQQADFESRADYYGVKRRRPFHERFEQSTVDATEDMSREMHDGESSGEEGWQDTGGNRLKDFGVDEDVEFYDEDDIPISELLRRRKAKP
ncbi:hypothetical protein LTR84_009487 [Exophiala bonariae]|uniref:Palmitoyltransferase pfa4 n=1 Tax=Exophiala bonariae TaxID=1690606 RepID=A0AAV9MUL2_9EURO|nr:hypothetical protein LTR84_009487 [Exophiala bonariae]